MKERIGKTQQHIDREETRTRWQEEIYGTDKRLNTALRKARADKINGKIIIKLYNQLTAERMALLTRLSTVHRLLALSKKLNKPFHTVTKTSWNKLVVQLEKEGYKDWTIHGFAKSLRRILKFLGKKNAYVKCKVRQSPIQPEDLVTLDDMQKLLATEMTIRERAFLMVLFESGVRIGELLSMRIGSLQFDNNGIKIAVSGKTGSRSLRIVTSYEPLMQYLQHHPFRDNIKAPLWIDTTGKMLKYTTSSQLLGRICRKAGIHKRIHHHLFRHSAVSRYSKLMPEVVLDGYFGWAIGSDMPSRYVHLNVNQTIDEKILEMHGLVISKEGNEQSRKCPRCRRNNSPTQDLCECGFCFDPTKAAVMEKEKEDKIEQLDRKYAQIEEKLKRLLEEP